jgi:FAD:protein FMN transferase
VGRSIYFDIPGMQVTLNGIAQGYAADRAREIMRHHGVEHALIDTGEWSAMGRGPQSQHWALAIENPRQIGSGLRELCTMGKSIATSSDSHCSFTTDRRFHHILNPTTGVSPTDIAQVSVVSDSCALADALTKVLFMSTAHNAMSSAKLWRVEAIVVDKQGQMHSTLV